MDEQPDVQQSYKLFQLLGSSRGDMIDPETGKRVPPIIEKYRGKPPETLVEEEHVGFGYGYDNARTFGGKFFYDGIASYILGSEILEWMKKPPSYVARDSIPEQIYNVWDGAGAPPDYSDMPSEERVAAKYIHVEWIEPCTACYLHFFEEVVRLMQKHSDIRLVYGWDC